MSNYIKLTEKQANELIKAVEFAREITDAKGLKVRFLNLISLLREKLFFIS